MFETNALLVALVLLNFLLLGSSRLAPCIRYVALQGLVLGLLTFAEQGFTGFGWRMIALAVGSVALKGMVFPWMLRRALREAEVRRENEPFVGLNASILVGMFTLGVALWLGARLPLPGSVSSTLAVPVALFTIFVGLFLIISRRTALSQVLGYLVLENGIFAFGLFLTADAPLSVELGMLLDVFVAVFVMGIVIFHINREFDHIDTDRMVSLKDEAP